MVNFFFTGRNLARGLWRKASSLCRRAVSGINWLKENFSDLLKKTLKFLSRPDVIFMIAFVVSLAILLSLGFGVGGIAAGSAAAAFQSAAFGAFTPAGSILAALTSMAMTGMYPVFAVVAAAIVGVVVMIVAKMFGQGQGQAQ